MFINLALNWYEKVMINEFLNWSAIAPINVSSAIISVKRKTRKTSSYNYVWCINLSFQFITIYNRIWLVSLKTPDPRTAMWLDLWTWLELGDQIASMCDRFNKAAASLGFLRFSEFREGRCYVHLSGHFNCWLHFDYTDSALCLPTFFLDCIWAIWTSTYSAGVPITRVYV
jgi:hypothetical protein